MQTRRARPPMAVARSDVSAVVKWFNPNKGFGFVKPDDGSPDAFLHISVLERAGYRELPEGAAVTCDLSEGPRGPQVANLRVDDASPAAVTMSSAPRSGGHDWHDEGDESGPIDGTVKFFNAEKGFGFIVPDDGSRDVFVSSRVLERIGMSSLNSDQKVRMTVRHGQKGPMAASVELL